ncbi:MAG TPA: thiol:disulfide interchange protein DsbA/DsbL [Burkholderiales bacterium]|nr:thiol:disulfide interchange protein DsbA/DsbL [Burkholderiales bacterium]
MKRLGRYRHFAAWFLALSLNTGAWAQLAPGKDYQLINPAQPTASGTKVEVIEFFYYGCPGCNGLQPPLRAWLKKKPADVEFRRAPVVFQDSWLPLTTAYHAFDAMGIVDKVHYELFRAIHEQRSLEIKGLLRDQKPLFDWVAKQGVDRQKFVDVYNSFGVRSRTNRSIELPGHYQVTSTPTLVVDGKFLMTPAMAGSYERYFDVLDQVIAMARKERAAKK